MKAKAVIVMITMIFVGTTCQVLADNKTGQAVNSATGMAKKKALDGQKSAVPFRFNRLMKSGAGKNLPPASDGIHDPENESAHILQSPEEGFSGFVKSYFGNGVDWVKTLEKETIKPRWDIEDPEEEPDIMELDIVREVKGSMPDVLYPHDKHTAWLTCENCHDEIFLPEAGGNVITMAEIAMGQKCGVCHGKVAFPITECKRCHSVKKSAKR